MKRAIVLSGGGGKGAYQVGVWKALRHLGINYDMVVGTSIGAINGVFMVQDDYYKVFELWDSINYDKIFLDSVDASYFDKKGRKKLFVNFAKAIVKGGKDTSPLRENIIKNIDEDKFYSSNIDYGLVTVKFPSFKPVMLTKKDIKKDMLVDYLLATSSCFPALKMTNINNKYYLDGCFRDNMPINLALKMGADEIIAVDLRAVDFKKIPNKPNVKITLIKSKKQITNFFVMEKTAARRSMKIGYNDTMKTFKELDGNYYTFKKDSLKINYDNLKEQFFSEIDFDKFKNIKKINRLKDSNRKKYFNSTIENLMKVFTFDVTKVYNPVKVNNILKQYIEETSKIDKKQINLILKDTKLSKDSISKTIISYFYNELFILGNNSKFIVNLITLFPDYYLCAIYLKIISKKEYKNG